jgi:hypothetical protein
LIQAFQVRGKMKGHHCPHSEITKQKLREYTGEKNSQYNKRWITNGIEEKKIRKEDISLCCDEEWKLGRKPITEEIRKKISLNSKGKSRSPRTEEHTKHLSESLKGIVPWNKGKCDCYSNETLQKQRVARLGKVRGPHKEETKRKIRSSLIKYRKENNIQYTIFGKNEKELLDKQEDIDKCKIIRNYEIKELGYFSDGYCRETNTIYEVYERFHDRTVFKDLERENKICNYLSCDFIILYDRTH